MALSDYLLGQPTLQNRAPRMPSGASQVTGSLEQMLAPNSAYIQNARQRGLEQAATRGGINSSIAAGAAERAAIEAAAPLVQQATQLDQTGVNAQYEDWLAQQNFGHSLFAERFSSSLGMLERIQQYGLEDPELYTPEVLSGFNNFFQQNMQDILRRYFNNG